MCPHCGAHMKAVEPQKFEEGEKIRCGSCFKVFIGAK